MYSTDPHGTGPHGKPTDGKLFALMVGRGDAGAKAWEVLYQRYGKVLYREVSWRLKGVPQPIVEDVVQDTFIQAFEVADTFREYDELGRRHSTRAWLRKFAINIYLGRLLKQRDVSFVSLTQEDVEDDSQLSTKGRSLSPGELHREIKDTEDVVSGNGNEDHVSPLMRLLCEALDSLTEIERYILIITYEYYQPGQKQPRLPNAVVKEISETYNISHDYVRQLRKRAIRKIKEYVDTRMP